MSSIKAKPYNYPLAEVPPALIIIDMQRDFVDEGGFGSLLGNDVRPLQNIIPTISHLLEVARRLGMLVIHTREAHKADLSDCPSSKLNRGDCKLKIGDSGSMGRILIEGEPGNDIVEALKPAEGEYNLTKPGKDAFYATALDEILKKHDISHILFAGVTTEVCVQSTMRAANDRGYECLIIEDGTESYFPEFKKATIEMIIAQGGIVGWSAFSDEIISALEKTYE